MMLLGIFVGGGLGALLRHFSILFFKTQLTGTFPFGTMFVNIVGSFIIGVIMAGVGEKWNISAQAQAFMVTGILGGFTTFSAFSFDVYKLANTGETLLAAAYVGLSVFLSLLAVFGGAYLVRGVLQ